MTPEPETLSLVHGKHIFLVEYVPGEEQALDRALTEMVADKNTVFDVVDAVALACSLIVPRAEAKV